MSALFLALTLAWPSPALALRPTGLEESGDKPTFVRALRAAVLGVPASSESLALPAADRTRLERLRTHIFDTLVRPPKNKRGVPPGGLVTPAWILQAVPGTRYQDLYLINLPAVVAQAEAHVTKRRPQMPRLFLYWRNDSMGLHTTLPMAESRLASGRVALFLQEHLGGPLSLLDIARGAAVDVSRLVTSLGRHSSYGVDVRTFVVLNNWYRAVEDSPRLPTILAKFRKSLAHAAGVRALQQYPGGYLPLKEFARLAGISRSNFEGRYLDPYLLMAVENARRAVANLRHPEDPPHRFIALDGMTAILHAIDQHPGGRTTIEKFAGLTGLAIRTLYKDYPLRTLLREGSARRAAETPPRSVILLPLSNNPWGPRGRRDRADAGLEEPPEVTVRRIVESWRPASGTPPRNVVVLSPLMTQALKIPLLRLGMFWKENWGGAFEQLLRDRLLLVSADPEFAAPFSVVPTPDAVVGVANGRRVQYLGFHGPSNSSDERPARPMPRTNGSWKDMTTPVDQLLKDLLYEIASSANRVPDEQVRVRLEEAKQLATALLKMPAEMPVWTPRLRPIDEVARELGLLSGEIVRYGDVIKFDAEQVLQRLAGQPTGEIIPVLGITSDGPGEGKTTTVVSLVEGLRALGVRAAGDLRQPSVGPSWGGEKGGATRFHQMQLYPGDLINLGFTGDFDVLDKFALRILAEFFNHIDRKEPGWPEALAARVVLPLSVDVQLRQLRRLLAGTGLKKTDHYPARLTGVLTAASEPMAILTVAGGAQDFRERLGQMIVALREDGTPIRVRDVGPSLVDDLLQMARVRRLLWPNLVQTLNGWPVAILGGPFANTALGTSALLNTRALLHLVKGEGIVAKEFGFAVTEGGQKAFDTFFPMAGLTPRVAVVVATIKALKYHGEGNLARGLANLDHHLRVVQAYGVTPVVALNRFADNAEEEISAVRDHVVQAFPGVQLAVNTGPLSGPFGAVELAQAVMKALQVSRAAGPSRYRPMVTAQQTIEEKLPILATQVYGAADVAPLSADVAAQIEAVRRDGHDREPAVISKTHKSTTEDPALRGALGGWLLHVDRVTWMAGAGYLLVEVGEKPVERLPAFGKRVVSFKPQALPSGTVLPTSGLEEISAARWQALEEGRTGWGLVVVPAGALSQFDDLAEFLAGLPPAFAADVVLWGEDQAARTLSQKNPALPFVQEPSVHALGTYLQGRGVSSATMLSRNDASWLRNVQMLVATYQVELTDLLRFDLTEFWQALGVPAEVSQQVGLEELVGERYVGSGT